MNTQMITRNRAKQIRAEAIMNQRNKYVTPPSIYTTLLQMFDQVSQTPETEKRCMILNNIFIYILDNISKIRTRRWKGFRAIAVLKAKEFQQDPRCPEYLLKTTNIILSEM